MSFFALVALAFILSRGIVSSPKDVPDLKKLGVEVVVFLNEPYETVLPSSLYHCASLINYKDVGLN
ncbi:Putative dual specificity protein phosphatase [Arachis hypogaea]|nr:Putative dual specificity protein phosphatase [Arachis hypogaea]